jgi:hypothetical protein
MSQNLELFIRVDQNGNPVDHPIFGDNFRLAFPDIDVDNLPSEFARFIRVQCPQVGVYEVLDSTEPSYQLVDGVFTDVWALREMTDAEKSAKQQTVIDQWTAMPSFPNVATWTFDEATCNMVPPTPRPESGNYAWKGATNSWELRSNRPDDDKEYRWDYVTWSWVEVV